MKRRTRSKASDVHVYDRAGNLVTVLPSPYRDQRAQRIQEARPVR